MENLKKAKFGNLNFESITILTAKEQSKIVGGYGSAGNDGPGRCQVCSEGIKGSTCGGVISNKAARNLVDELNDRKDGYYYYKVCDENP